jgi:hypothetical protein
MGNRLSIEDAAHCRVRPGSAFLGSYVPQREFSGNLLQRVAGPAQLVHQFDGLLLNYVWHQQLAIGGKIKTKPQLAATLTIVDLVLQRFTSTLSRGTPPLSNPASTDALNGKLVFEASHSRCIVSWSSLERISCLMGPGLLTRHTISTSSVCKLRGRNGG